MKKSICFLICTFLILMTVRAQEKTNTSNSYLSAGLKQIKESAYFGLVFNGPNMNFGDYWELSKNNQIFSIEHEI